MIFFNVDIYCVENLELKSIHMPNSKAHFVSLASSSTFLAGYPLCFRRDLKILMFLSNVG